MVGLELELLELGPFGPLLFGFGLLLPLLVEVGPEGLLLPLLPLGVLVGRGVLEVKVEVEVEVEVEV